MRLEDITAQALLTGIIPGSVVRVVACTPIGPDAVNLVFKGADGRLQERMLFRADEDHITLAVEGRPWGLDGNAGDFKLGAEAYRIHLAHLFDPLMAIHTSNVEPLPHQITAVYEAMLPRRPLRFVLADDPGAGKTIMAGLLIRELMVRGDLERCLIVAPGSLSEQWQDELLSKFNLSFEIFSRELVEASANANPFAEKPLLICRVDQLARADDLREKLKTTCWDIIIVDEAHKLSATYFGNELKRTKRYQLGEQLGEITRHFLLMTATPHNGKEEDFQAFLALLDADRFYGKFRDGTHQVNVSDLMRRMIKEEMVRFDGTPLFPERIAETVNYPLSQREAALYAQVTSYVSTEMNRAQNLDDKRKGTVGFALTILQRRLASSPEAIYRSLERRLGRLEDMLREAHMTHRGLSALGSLPEMDQDQIDEVYDNLGDAEIEELEEQVVDQATAAQTVKELEKEIARLRELVALAKEVRLAGEDYKWRELRSLLDDNPHMKDGNGNRRKLIIFTEHRDTLNYLHDRISGLVGRNDGIERIHGGVKREERKKSVERFTNYADSTILLATDAAGEGVNLQCAHLMVNYDMPWNPNRLEQRFGRIHRIGQTEVCRLWNLVSHETREGQVFKRLFEKLEQERATLQGKVFDILGKVFEQRSLKDLLMEAICYGEREDVRARLYQQMDLALDRENIQRIMERDAIGCEHLSAGQVFQLKEKMQQAEAVRLQPHFVQAFFAEAFRRLGGDLKRREEGRFEISYVPQIIVQRDRVIGARAPVVEKYSRVCFEKQHVRPPGRPPAALIAPGHALMDTTVDLMLERYRPLLKQGTVFVNPKDLGTTPRMLFIIDHSVRDGGTDAQGRDRVISRRLQFVLLDAQGNATAAGPAPYLDYELLPAEAVGLHARLLAEPWLRRDLEQQAMAYAASHLVPDHFAEVRQRRLKMVDATLRAVHERLTVEINYWTHRYQQLLTEVEAGRQPRMQPENARRTAETLSTRLEKRTKDLEAQRNVMSSPPVIVGGALVISQGLLLQTLGRTAPEDLVDAAAKAEMERRGMEAVMQHERRLGFTPRDVSAEDCGWDVTSTDAKGNCRFIEVKARRKDATTVTVSKNEMLVGFNKRGEGWYLALVFVDGDTADGPHYIAAPFDREPGWAETSVNLSIPDLLNGIGNDLTK